MIGGTGSLSVIDELGHMQGSHSTPVVLLSLAVAFLASFAGLDLAARTAAARGRARLAWLLGSSVTMGVGIWSMHGVAMLAFRLPTAVRYDARLATASVLLAVVGSAVALTLASRRRLGAGALTGGGLCMGISVAGMHYLGIASMRLAATVTYAPALVAASVAIAVMASGVALWLAFTLREETEGISLRRIAAAAVMGLAIAGMHYTGMHAAHFHAAEHTLPTAGLSLSSRTMFEVTAMTTLLVLTAALSGLLFGRRLRTQAATVHDLARAEAALRASDERYQLVTRATNDVIWDWDMLTGEILLSDAREQVLDGATPRTGRMIVRTVEWLLSHVHRDDIDAVRASIDATRAGTSAVWVQEYRTQRSDGSYADVMNRAHVVRAADGTPLRAIGAMMDVSDRKRAERALHDARDAAQAASRAKSDFLANMSHEIRTPMNGVMGMLDLTLDTDLSDDQRDYLQVAQASAESLLTVINDILDFSKIEAGKLSLSPAPFRLRDMLGDTIRTLALRADQKGLELALSVQPDVPESLFGDADRLRQVLINLVGNAIKFTAHGEVVVRVDTVPNEAGTEPDDVTLHVAVADTGIGIPAEKQQLIFEAFSQADTSTTRTYGGTGLGLAISTQLVTLMGGRIRVESVPDQGSTFHVTVRLGRRASTVSTPAVGRRASLAGMPVLVVDDNATNRRILEETLLGWQMRPTLASGGHEALEAIERARRAGTPFRLVLLDAQMPQMDGFDVAEAISDRRGELAGTTVMMLSSSGRHANVARCAELGIASYLTKPVKSSQLLDAILALLDPAPAAREAATPVAGLAARPLRVLLAEDNLVNQKLAVGLLQKRGHLTTVAGNGRLALEALEREQFDLVLMDVQMPEMGGFEATRAIRERERATGAHIPIVAMTARAMAGDREACLAAGMDAYLAKPIRPGELIALVEEIGIGAAAPVAPTTPETGRQNTLRVLDEAALLALVGGDETLMHEIIDLYLRESPRLLREIRAASAAGDTGALQFSAHALKGSVGNMAAARAYAAAMALETAARAGDLDASRTILATVEHEFSLVQDILTNLVPEPAR
jgi:two-component system, sensor histidine kinase and response regulator